MCERRMSSPTCVTYRNRYMKTKKYENCVTMHFRAKRALIRVGCSLDHQYQGHQPRLGAGDFARENTEQRRAPLSSGANLAREQVRQERK